MPTASAKKSRRLSSSALRLELCKLTSDLSSVCHRLRQACEHLNPSKNGQAGAFQLTCLLFASSSGERTSPEVGPRPGNRDARHDCFLPSPVFSGRRVRRTRSQTHSIELEMLV